MNKTMLGGIFYFRQLKTDEIKIFMKKKRGKSDYGQNLKKIKSASPKNKNLIRRPNGTTFQQHIPHRMCLCSQGPLIKELRS